jgi:mRNA-degrading endonuclease RelE of RelBE toxin-antitoxin system
MLQIFYTDTFKKNVKKLYKKNKQIRQDIDNLIGLLRENPTSGSPLGNNCFKVRLKDSSNKKGKSGGYRVITYFLEQDENLTLLTIYAKSERSTISDKELNNILKNLPQ